MVTIIGAMKVIATASAKGTKDKPIAKNAAERATVTPLKICRKGCLVSRTLTPRKQMKMITKQNRTNHLAQAICIAGREAVKNFDCASAIEKKNMPKNMQSMAWTLFWR